MNQKNIYIALILLLLIVSCKPKQKFDVDLSNVEKVDIKIKRYEQALFKINPARIRIGLNAVKAEYPFFIGDNIDTFAIMSLYNYVTDSNVVKTYKDTRDKYRDIKSLEKDLSLALRHFKYYYPEKAIPIVYSYVSGFDYEYPIKYIDSVLIIALDMYLGQDYYFYPLINLPGYKTYRMRKESIVVDCMTEIARSIVPENKGQYTFLDQMIYEGKLLYFLDLTLPDLNDSLKIGFKTSQLEWCKRNEANMWGFFMEQNFLYSNDKKVILRFIDDGPYTPSFEGESPARTGAFIGWQIVRAYMSNNNTSIKEFFLMNDSQQILKKSKYKPKK